MAGQLLGNLFYTIRAQGGQLAGDLAKSKSVVNNFATGIANTFSQIGSQIANMFGAAAIISTAFKAIQELADKNDELEAKIKELEKK